MIVGKQSLSFEQPVYIEAAAAVVGEKEGQGPLARLFDEIVCDPLVGTNSWEEAESMLQQIAVDKLLSKWDKTKEEIRYIFAGDLLGQLIATSFGLEKYDIPLFGLYGACSTFAEALSLGSITVGGGFAKHVIALASSHFASAEKQFRFPLEYGNQRPPASTWTVTGCGAVILGTDKAAVKITGITTGKVVDYGVKDAMNMGACMAPAAADTIRANFREFDIDEPYYDKIITGDLGVVGKKILLDLLKEKGFDVAERVTDCGIEIFDGHVQDTHAGGSGCGCSAVTLCSYIIRNIKNHVWNRVLFVPTGALLSTVSSNEGNAIPGIAHAIMLEGTV